MKLLSFLSAAILLPLLSRAQATLPEQDCIGAIHLCGSYEQATPYQGIGSIEDIQDGTSCLGNEENNSAWFIFEIASAGTLEFTITSLTGDSIDLDFALFNLTHAVCADIYNGGLEVRCNYAFSLSQTGLRPGYNLTSVAIGNGPPFCSPLLVEAGERFALMVDDFDGANGFRIDFADTSATLGFQPHINAAKKVICQGQELLLVQFNQTFPCDIFNVNGSNFHFLSHPSITIDSIQISDCSNGSSTNYMMFSYSGELEQDSIYTLVFQPDSTLTVCSVSADTIIFSLTDTVIRPEADFSFQINGNEARFTNLSQPPVMAYSWLFGDGYGSTAESPAYDYTDVGTYNACLIA